jgi:hypothetical protein
MIWNVPGPANQTPLKLQRIVGRQWILIQVQTPGAIRIATQQSELLNTIGGPQSGIYDGFEIDGGSSLETWWEGDLWVIPVTDGGAVVKVIRPGSQPGT